MASSFMIETITDVDPEVLFDRCLDVDAHVDSMRSSGERAVAGVTSGRLGPDDSVTWRARHVGVRFTMTVRITAFDRPHRFVDEQVAGPFRTFRHEHSFRRVDGHTVMTDMITLASPLLGSVAERLVLVPYLRRLIRTRNAYLLQQLR